MAAPGRVPRRQHHEARPVVAHVLDVSIRRVHPEKLRRPLARYRGRRAVAVLHVADGRGRAQRRDRLCPGEVAGDVGAALGQCLRMRVDDRHVARPDTGLSQQAMVDREDDFLPDPEFRMVNQDVDRLGDRTLKAVLDRDDGCIGGSVFRCAHGRGDGPERHEDGPFDLEGGLLAVGPRGTEVCQLHERFSGSLYTTILRMSSSPVSQ